MGDERSYSFIPSRAGNTLSDKVAKHILKWNVKKYNSYTWKSKDELRDGLLNYMNSFDSLTFTPGINLPGENVVDGFYLVSKIIIFFKKK